MRFMLIRLADADTEAGALPDGKLVTAMMQYNEELLQAGAMRAGDGLQPSAKGARIRFSNGSPNVTDGPFADTRELVAGYTMLDVKSKEEAIAWVKRWPAADGNGQVEIEVREVGCPGGLAGVAGVGHAAEAAPVPDTPGPGLMRFMVILKADRNAEAGVIPEPARLAAMARHNDEHARAGVILAADGLQPSSRGARVKFSGGKPTVIDGPFSEAKELIAGYWVIQVKSKAEAIEWAKRYPYPFDGEIDVEVRQLYEASDFGDDFAAVIERQEARLRNQDTCVGMQSHGAV